MGATTLLARPAFHAAAALVLACAGTVGLPTVARAAVLGELQNLPLTISAAGLFGAGGGRWRLIAETGDPATEIVTTDGRIVLPRLADSSTVPGESHFRLSVHDQREAKVLMLDFRTDGRRCLLTTIDPVLNQSSESGRTFEVFAVLQAFEEHRSVALGEEVVVSLRGRARLASPFTLCAADSGALTLLFSTPAFDLLHLSVVSHSSRSGAPLAAASAALEFPVADGGAR